MRNRILGLLAVGLLVVALIGPRLTQIADAGAERVRPYLHVTRSFDHGPSGIAFDLRFVRAAAQGAATAESDDDADIAVFLLDWPSMDPVTYAASGTPKVPVGRYQADLGAGESIQIIVQDRAYDGRGFFKGLCPGIATHRALRERPFGLYAVGIRRVGDPAPTRSGTPAPGPFPYPSSESYVFFDVAEPVSASTKISCKRDRTTCSARYVHRGICQSVTFDRAGLADWRRYRAAAEAYFDDIVQTWQPPHEDWIALVADREISGGPQRCIKDGALTWIH